MHNFRTMTRLARLRQAEKLVQPVRARCGPIATRHMQTLSSPHTLVAPPQPNLALPTPKTASHADAFMLGAFGFTTVGTVAALGLGLKRENRRLSSRFDAREDRLDRAKWFAPAADDSWFT